MILNRLDIRSLKWQVLIRSFLILIFLLLIMGISQYMIMRQFLYNNKDQFLESRIHNVDKSIIKGLKTPELVREKSKFIIHKISDRNINVVIINDNGKVILGDSYKAPYLSEAEYKELINVKGELKEYRIIKDKNKNTNTSIVKFIKTGNPYSSSGLIQVSSSTQLIHFMLERAMYIYIIAAIFIIFIGAIIGGTVLSHTLKPLYSVTRTLKKITAEKLDMRLPIDNGQSEIDSLSKAFNEMLERIEISFEKEQKIREKMQRFVSDASHELRTPLTSIHGFVEILLRGAAKNETQLKLALNTILTDTERLTKLVNDLLLLAKLDEEVQIEITEDDIKEIIEEIYPQLQIIAGERKINLNLEENIILRVNKDQVKQVIFNLFQNAVQHTDERKGVISINLTSVDQCSDFHALLQVEDNGAGIPNKDLNGIFDRFFRSEFHRSRKEGGFGLGLSIVNSIINAHRGEINIKSELGKGVIVSIYLR
ncbi:sensor histidine kinase [Clostridium cylindrosporum]|uniref:histidine kinase n=1 Tax=Clostridium cylindrosporum DSM 605 TaxID=1121307 RepID=A0A0J8DGE7_CLOCY|nr:HAMP domain-containing sensor histidine kinase [Clostridium cylindrosporum]KMT23238.1 signal transduction histidine kinase [Clostridium cylindrosporum DSM 605]